MCIKRRKKPQLQRGDTRTSSDGEDDTRGKPSPSRRASKDETKPPMTSGSDRRLSGSFRKFSSATTTMDHGGSNSSKHGKNNGNMEIFVKKDNIINKNSAETECGNPLPLNSINQSPEPLGTPEIKEKEVLPQAPRQHDQPLPRTSPTQPEPQLDRTQDMTEDLPIAPTQVASSRIKPKPCYQRAASSAKITPTDFKGKTTPLITDYLNKKPEKDPQLQELSRMPVVKTSNIVFEKFPYASAGHQDTLAGVTSNFSESIELPDGKGMKESKRDKKHHKEEEHQHKRHPKPKTK